MAAPSVIFIGGLGRSGSTLVERLLGEIPGVAALGEVVHLWARGVQADEPCGCGKPFAQCPFWQNVGGRAFGQWREDQADRMVHLRGRVDRTRRIPGHILGLTGREAELAEYVKAYSRLYGAAAHVAGARAVVDSSKHASLAYCLDAVIDVRAVHVVRDPRAVAASWRSRVRRPEDGRPMTCWTPARTAVHWLVQNAAFEILRRRGVDVIRVRHEDLVANPVETLTRLARRLGLPCDPEDLDFLQGREVRLGVAHTVSGNPVRFTVGSVEIRGRHAALPRHQRWLVSALTWPLLLRYGYRLACRTASRGTASGAGASVVVSAAAAGSWTEELPR